MNRDAFTRALRYTCWLPVICALIGAAKLSRESRVAPDGIYTASAKVFLTPTPAQLAGVSAPRPLAPAYHQAQAEILMSPEMQQLAAARWNGTKDAVRVSAADMQGAYISLTGRGTDPQAVVAHLNALQDAYAALHLEAKSRAPGVTLEKAESTVTQLEHEMRAMGTELTRLSSTPDHVTRHADIMRHTERINSLRTSLDAFEAGAKPDPNGRDSVKVREELVKAEGLLKAELDAQRSYNLLVQQQENTRADLVKWQHTLRELQSQGAMYSDTTPTFQRAALVSTPRQHGYFVSLVRGGLIGFITGALIMVLIATIAGARGASPRDGGHPAAAR